MKKGDILKTYWRELILMLSLVLVVVSLISFVTYRELENSLSDSYLKRLSIVKNDILKDLSDYFREKEKLILTLSLSGTTVDAFNQFRKSFNSLENEFKENIDSDKKFQIEDEFNRKLRSLEKTLSLENEINISKDLEKREIIAKNLYIYENPLSSNYREKLFSSKFNLSYDKVHEKFHKYFSEEVLRYELYDLFLIDVNGDIIYSNKKEFDFGANLLKGEISKTSFGKLFQKANSLERCQTIFSDFEYYQPSLYKLSSFAITPIFKESFVVGYIAIQFSIDDVFDIINVKRDNLNTFLVGENFILKSDYEKSIYSEDKSLDQLFLERYAKYDFLKTKEGRLFQNEKGVFSAISTVKTLYKNWALILNIEEEEIDKNIGKTIKRVLISTTILSIIFTTIIVYIFFRFVLRPIEKSHIAFKRRVDEKSEELEKSMALLDEYKRAVDYSSIVSKADRKGFITYVNDSFCEISGYNREELIGSPHNIVRHEDMPKEVFRELWATISSKRVWKGVVKNRKKDGGEYYVHSTVIPMLNENGEIKEFISIRNDVTELIQKEKKILQQTTDNLTNLPNRQKLLEDISVGEQKLKLAIVQIDKFKEINDFYGIDTANLLLISITSILRRIIHEVDGKLYKIGGDEFAVLECSGTPIKDFNKKIDNLIKYFDHNIIVIEDNSFNVSVTVGMSIGDRTKLFFNSEMALRKAIENGKDFISFENSHDLEKNYQQNIEMTTKIKSAIANDKIVIYGQPIKSNYRSDRGKYEVLVRMIDGDKIISPFFFLEIAKKARLYSTITKIVIEKSFQYFKDREEEFSINLTIEDILNDDIVNFLRKKIIETKIGHRVILELVESEGIDNFETVHKFIEEVKSLGCKIAIDDFGTGYSNFEYLMKLNVDFIKIDGSLIKNIHLDENSQLVVQLIVEFAKKKRIKSVAEFIHNSEVYSKVKSMGIDYSQGYYLGEPALLS
jgi:PAS domain S-box-containing protein/diguanylate cyclase (GGDEF)-like protein